MINRCTTQNLALLRGGENGLQLFLCTDETQVRKNTCHS